MNLFDKIKKTVIRTIELFKKGNKDIEISDNNIDINEISKYIDIKNNNTTRFFVPNPNLYFKTYNKIISNTHFFEEIYKYNYQIRTVIDQLIKRINALDITYEECQSLTNTNNKLKAKRINNFIEKQINQLFGYNNTTGFLEDTAYIINYLGKAFINGKSILQIVYRDSSLDEDDGYFNIDHIEYCDPTLFDFLEEDNQLIYRHNNTYDILNKYQFISHTNNGSTINPHGISLIGESGYYLHYIHMNLLDDFLEYSKRHGYPSWEVTANSFEDKLTGDRIVPNKDIVTQANEFAKNIRSGSSIAHTDDISINQIKNETGQFDYIKSIEMIERSITKLIIGSTTVIQNSENNGSMALGNIHEHATLSIIEEGAKAMQDTLNKIIYNLLDLNGFDLTGIKLPRINIKYKKDTLNEQEVSFMIKAVELGAPVSIKQFMKNLKLTTPNFISDDDIFNKELYKINIEENLNA